ncbi:hypothetical protein C495_04092 [Natronorubrum sulfidifaciens JCM 14089]|uniref:Uncharacterized protein n=1 Tax=Natronorubrum sulfidifaciens JCM 14089 TaxID=1230460 RepID=L9WD47_9EURY|nr:hypothetical protein C495_04092 [Natronorubrum sulfidifaciens JCM 14089]
MNGRMAKMFASNRVLEKTAKRFNENTTTEYTCYQQPLSSCEQCSASETIRIANRFGVVELPVRGPSLGFHTLV